MTHDTAPKHRIAIKAATPYRLENRRPKLYYADMLNMAQPTPAAPKVQSATKSPSFPIAA